MDRKVMPARKANCATRRRKELQEQEMDPGTGVNGGEMTGGIGRKRFFTTKGAGGAEGAPACQ